jgi:flagellar FliL protein
MAKATKPAPAGAKSGAKPTEGEIVEDVAPKKSKKKLIIIVIVALVLLVGGGAVALMLLKPPVQKHDAEGAGAEAKPAPEMHDTSKPPTFVDLGSFTANLVHEEGDRYLQATIQLKLANPELVDKIKASAPEIQHRVNMLLQSKRPSELFTYEGKEMLATQIRGQIEYVLGMRKAPPPINPEQAAAEPPGRSKTEISEVLFTSFIIQ